MSIRFFVEDTQIFGNNEVPEIVVDELKRQGLKEEGIDDGTFVFDATNPDALLLAIEKYTKYKLDEFIRRDNVVNDKGLLVSHLMPNYWLNQILHVNFDSETKHSMYKVCLDFLDSNLFMIPLNFVYAVCKKCMFNYPNDKLEFRNGYDSIHIICG